MELPDFCITVNECANIFCKEYNTDAKIITAYLTFHLAHTVGPCVVNTDLFPKLDTYTTGLIVHFQPARDNTHSTEKINEAEIK
jgi:hypothetical protein